jgi:nucleoside-diphosphate-sugar epimerase
VTGAGAPNGAIDPSPAAVVTGAAGWLGQNLVRALAPNRDRVRCLVRDKSDASLLSVIGPSIEPIVGDVRDPAALDALFDGVGPATVFHAAGVIHPEGKLRSLYDVNVGGTQLTLDRARRAGAVRFVHVSSNSPFGANDGPNDRFTENSPFNPYMAYGQSKLEGEQLVMRAFEHGDLQTVIVRPPWFYGPFQPQRQTQFLAAVRRGRFPLVGDGTQQRSMVFTGNLVLGMLLAETAAKAPGNAYWIADARPYELRDVFDTVRQAFADEGMHPTASRTVRIPVVAAKAAEAADRFVQGRGRYVQAVHVLGELKDTIACDITRARDELGYAPPTDLLAGMRESIRWCLANGEQL